MKHRYAEMLGWLAEGKPVLGRIHGGAEAVFPENFNAEAVEAVLHGYENWEFRLKPRTVKIGSREVEAPVLEPVVGQELWYWRHDDGEAQPSRVPHPRKIAAGCYFASPEACLAAHEAMTALLRGEA